MIALPFVNVGKETYDIQDIVCQDGDSVPAGEGLFTLSWYDTEKGGYSFADYAPFGYADDGEAGGDGTYYDDKWYWLTDLEWQFIRVQLGWKHDKDAPATINDHGKTFGPGEAFFVRSEGENKDPKITVAGEVPAFDTTKEYIVMDGVRAEKKMFSNPFVSSFDIQEIICFDGNSTPAGEGLFTLSWYDTVKGGYSFADYAPFGYADDGEAGGDGTYYDDKWYWLTDLEWQFIRVPLGWKHDKDAPATINDHGKAFAAGEGFYVRSEGENNAPKIGFKNPFYVAPVK